MSDWSELVLINANQTLQVAELLLTSASLLLLFSSLLRMWQVFNIRICFYFGFLLALNRGMHIATLTFAKNHHLHLLFLHI